MKHIIVKKCTECPFWTRWYIAQQSHSVCAKTGIDASAEELFKNCPLAELPTRGEVGELLKEYEGCMMPSEDLLDKLGWKGEA